MPLPMFTENQLSPRIIAIAAGKGGVGKSSVTVNLALALQKLGYRVGIIDADIYGPSIRKMLPEERAPKQEGDRIVPAVCQGIRMISIAYFRKEQEATAVRAPIANSVISQFMRNVEWGDLDYLLVDFPPGTGDIPLTLSQQAHFTGALMITTPQEVSLMDVRKAIHLFHHVKIPILGIIENMSYYYHEATKEFLYLFGRGGGERLAQEAGAPLLGNLPLYPDICRYGDEGKSLFSEKNEASKLFLHLAEKMMLHIEKLKKPDFPALSQTNSFSVTVQWNEKDFTVFPLNVLQKNCPCAHCVEEISGKRLVNTGTLTSPIEASHIAKIGQYGIRISFNSGCTTGIFSYDYLLHLAGTSSCLNLF